MLQEILYALILLLSLTGFYAALRFCLVRWLRPKRAGLFLVIDVTGEPDPVTAVCMVLSLLKLCGARRLPPTVRCREGDYARLANAFRNRRVVLVAVR